MSITTAIITVKRIHSSTEQSEIGTAFLTMLSMHYSMNNSGITTYLYKLYLRYFTSCGERESRPFHDEPETFISILISTTIMHVEPFLLCTAGTSTATDQESSSCWSLTVSRKKKEIQNGIISAVEICDMLLERWKIRCWRNCYVSRKTAL